ncbi:FtsQ-type POTRA domain-containing protein [Ruminococcus sp.]|uniref:cell division protein FtsQ/DivIB n=1 Tax=Ruminococcus sp. TaxID=41978 RepID=UPI0025E97812|nr:FtsQ-type POTRA domain-containing protein [Ruminococcus sp.]MCI5816876.1 FtsQ-type POTRA domain-containing protein [Ruminococcus sp.]MDD7555613.1 FtsQ-type POTRA domain-containing protein [Ruminococcus sp.]MDY4963335.1 FtsQ-type POTRA domain-containing protein [Ruminococcus callidus]
MQEVVKTSVKRKQNSKRQRRRRRNMSMYILLVLILVVGIGFALSMTMFFNIKTIRVTGDTEYTEQEVFAASGIQVGDNLMRLDTVAVSNSILSRLLNAEEVYVQKHFPSTVEIIVKPCVPTACVAYEGGYLIVSAKGKILENAKEPKEGLLLFKGYNPEFLEPGQMLTSAEDQKNSIYSAFLGNPYGADITVVDMTDQYDIVVHYGDRIRFEIGNANEISYKLRLAATAIPRLNESKKYNLRMVGDNQISAVQQEPAVTTAPDFPEDPEGTGTTETTAAPAE